MIGEGVVIEQGSENSKKFFDISQEIYLNFAIEKTKTSDILFPF